MIIPEYWAEAKIRTRIQDRQVTVKRFGWSDDSQEAAQLHADERAAEAMARIESGETLKRYENKVPYNGADGLPIREEIVARHGDVVITRNSYGALCLNTPNVLFADVDTDDGPGPRIYVPLFVVLVGAALGIGLSIGSGRAVMFSLIAAMVLLPFVADIIFRIMDRANGGPDMRIRKAIESFLESRRDWRLRLYKTPAGYRILALHRLFEPRCEDVQEFFTAMKSDPVYVRMCKNQNCFRARVSPKPWRIGVERCRPRSGVWPLKPERVAQLMAWVQGYESAAEGFASCRFEEEFGGGVADYRVAQVRELHDRYAKASSELPLG